MPIAPLPTPLQHLSGRRFSFYPPIRNIEHNEWLYRRATWSECVVANMRSGQEVWVPRLFIGEVSRRDDPAVIVGLNRELAWVEGVIIPHQRRVIELPVAVNEGRPAPGHPIRLAPVVNIRLDPKPEFRAGKWIGVALVLGVAVCTILADIALQPGGRGLGINRFGANQEGDLFRASRSYLRLESGDDYAAIVRKLGLPAEDRSYTENGRKYRVLAYPRGRFSVVLAGATQADVRYIGALDMHGRALDTARGGGGLVPAL